MTAPVGAAVTEVDGERERAARLVAAQARAAELFTMLGKRDGGADGA